MTTSQEQAIDLITKNPRLAHDFLVMSGHRQSVIKPLDHRESAEELIRKELLGSIQEKIMAIAIDLEERVIGHEVLFMGTTVLAPLDFKIIFRWLLTLEQLPSAFYLSHCHPSMPATPSNEDFDVTVKLRKASEIMQIRLLDHLVLGEGGKIVSIREMMNLTYMLREKLK